MSGLARAPARGPSKHNDRGEHYGAGRLAFIPEGAQCKMLPTETARCL